MKALKPLLVTAVILFVVVVVVQNRAILTDTETVRLNLWVKAYETPPIQLSIYFLGFFLIGFLLSYFQGLSQRFKTRNAIKAHLQKISKLEEEVKVLKSLPLQGENPPFNESEPA
jgi:uncharacterized integral membrane protein